MDGRTPLHWAAYQASTISLLCQYWSILVLYIYIYTVLVNSDYWSID